MSKKDKAQIKKAIITNGAIQFTYELNTQFNGSNVHTITKIEYKKFALSVYAHKQLLCRFYDCPVYAEYV